MTTTRRHPRSLEEAFPTLRASCVELPDGTTRGYWQRSGARAMVEPIPTVWWLRLLKKLWRK